MPRGDFKDAEEVLREVGAELGLRLDRLCIFPLDSITVQGAGGSIEYVPGLVYVVEDLKATTDDTWVVVRDARRAREIAVETAQVDIYDVPGDYPFDLLAAHVDMARLRRDVYEEAYSSNLDALDAPRNRPEVFWSYWEGEGLKLPKFPLAGAERMFPTQEEVEGLASVMARNQTLDPLSYLVANHGRAAQQMLVNSHALNTKDAAEEAVRHFGVEYYLTRGRGHVRETPSGYQYWLSGLPKLKQRQPPISRKSPPSGRPLEYHEWCAICGGLHGTSECPRQWER
jgi:hypothetical protein